jgi:hypothetical protein
MASDNYIQRVSTFQALSPDNRLPAAETRDEKNVKALTFEAVKFLDSSQLHFDCN